MKVFHCPSLEDVSNRHILITLVSERINKLNPYAPLAKRLMEIRSDLQKFRDDKRELEVKRTSADQGFLVGRKKPSEVHPWIFLR